MTSTIYIVRYTETFKDSICNFTRLKDSLLAYFTNEIEAVAFMANEFTKAYNANNKFVTQLEVSNEHIYFDVSSGDGEFLRGWFIAKVKKG